MPFFRKEKAAPITVTASRRCEPLPRTRRGIHEQDDRPENEVRLREDNRRRDGNALEFYDLFIYGLLAIVIAKVFFPAGSEFIDRLG